MSFAVAIGRSHQGSRRQPCSDRPCDASQHASANDAKLPHLRKGQHINVQDERATTTRLTASPTAPAGVRSPTHPAPLLRHRRRLHTASMRLLRPLGRLAADGAIECCILYFGLILFQSRRARSRASPTPCDASSAVLCASVLAEESGEWPGRGLGLPLNWPAGAHTSRAAMAEPLSVLLRLNGGGRHRAVPLRRSRSSRWIS